MKTEYYSFSKQYRKEQAPIKKAINKALLKLSERIEASGEKDVNKIFDERIVYDRHKKNNIFTFKLNIDGFSLRFLYAAYIEDDTLRISLIDYFIKKKSADKSYLRNFTDYALRLSVEKVFREAVVLG